MKIKRNWSKEEYDYLEESWGRTSIPHIAEKLGRSGNAVKIKAVRLGLGPVLESGDYISFNQLIYAVTGHKSYTYYLKSWVENRGFPMRYKKVNECRFRIVYLHEFWEWAEKNRSFIDFSKMEPLILGEEPDWVAEQRRKDYHSFCLQRKDPWTKAEDNRLIHLLKQQKYGYAEMSSMLHRSAGAIQRRCRDLGVMDRPVKADNHGNGAEWTADMYDILADGIRSGDSYTMIGNTIGKSEKAVRGKVYNTYFTEQADKIREMIGDGPWGAGVPVPSVKKAKFVAGYRVDIKKNISVIAYLLQKRMYELGYEPYWQRHMCMKWNDLHGCSAGCDNCDSCTEFERIKPQYCVRCGGTFYEREQNRFCEKCRTARKKSAQKKYAILKKRGRL